MRQIPEGFADVAHLLTSELKLRFKTGNATLARWRKECGHVPTRKGGKLPTPVPEDFATYAPIERNHQLAARYGVARGLVFRWRKAAGIPGLVGGPKRPGDTKPLRPLPPDFARIARGMSSHALQAHYRTSQRVIARWRRETGVWYETPMRKSEPFKRAPAPKPKQFIWTGKKLPVVPPRDSSLEGAAAETLRRIAPVYRCDERGRQDCAEARRSFWRFGAIVITADEMLQRARSKGWSPAW